MKIIESKVARNLRATLFGVFSLNTLYLFLQHHHRKPVGFLGCKLADATKTDGLHLRFLDTIVDELLGDVPGTGNAQCAVTFGSSGSFVGSTRDVDGQMMLLGILGDLCEVCQLRLGDQLCCVQLQLEIEIDRDTNSQLERVFIGAVIGGCCGCHTTAESVQSGIVVLVGRQCATVLLPVDLLLAQRIVRLVAYSIVGVHSSRSHGEQEQ